MAVRVEINELTLAPRASLTCAHATLSSAIREPDLAQVTSDATIECRERLALPSHPDWAVMLRRVIALTGTARVDVVLHPR